jgi:hypothetical protein
VLEENKESAWQEYKRRSRPIIVDLLMWITVLGAMAIIYAILKLMESMGYSHDAIGVLEKIHYLGSAGILIVVLYNTFMQVLAFSGGGR